jgi:malate permease and related proteins
VSMINELFAIMAPTLVGTLIGWAWGKRGGDYPAEFVSKIVMTIGTPCLIISAMDKVTLSSSVMSQVALAFFLVMAVSGILGFVYLTLRQQNIQAFLPLFIFPNTGNMGLPLCLFAFGQDGLALALGCFMAMLMAQFTIGLAIVEPTKGNFFKRCGGLLSQPVVIAMVISTCFLFWDISLPRWMANTCNLLGGLAIPLMIVALGVSLANFRVKYWSRALLFSIMRILGGASLGWMVTQLLGIDGVAADVVILQSAMPMAVMNYMLALKYNHQPDEVAASVLVSTLLGFFALPVLILVLKF